MNRHSIDSVSVESVESSVLNLIKTWCIRQKWDQFFNHSHQDLMLNRSSWRKSLVKFLESTLVRGFAILLLLLDLILTILELSSALLSCSQEKNETEEVWYHWIGIAILGLLSARTIALAVGLGSSFLLRPGYVVDAVVLIAALFLEAFLEKKGGGLLVLVSLWRIVRVVESAFELSDEAIEAQIEVIVFQFEALKEENRRLLETIAEKDVIIDKLQEVIEQLQEELNQCKQSSDRSQ